MGAYGNAEHVAKLSSNASIAAGLNYSRVSENVTTTIAGSFRKYTNDLYTSANIPMVYISVNISMIYISANIHTNDIQQTLRAMLIIYGSRPF